MAPDADDSPGGSEGHRAVPAPFLTKTYQLVDDASTDDVVSWGDETTFIVWKPMEFARDLLPLFFKHDNFSSFVRQLNTYGFRKVVPDRWEFGNYYFRRGSKHLLCDIHRRKTNGQAPLLSPVTNVIPREERQLPSPTATSTSLDLVKQSPPSSPSSLKAQPSPVDPTSLIEENEKLRRDNAFLSSELARFQHLYVEMVVSVQGQARPPFESAVPGRWIPTSGPSLWMAYPQSAANRRNEVSDPAPRGSVSQSKPHKVQPVKVPSSGQDQSGDFDNDTRQKLLEDAVAHMKQKAAGYPAINVHNTRLWSAVGDKRSGLHDRAVLEVESQEMQGGEMGPHEGTSGTSNVTANSAASGGGSSTYNQVRSTSSETVRKEPEALRSSAVSKEDEKEGGCNIVEDVAPAKRLKGEAENAVNARCLYKGGKVRSAKAPVQQLIARG